MEIWECSYTWQEDSCAIFHQCFVQACKKYFSYVFAFKSIFNTGAYVIGTCSTKDKAKKAKEAGADEVILYREKDFVDEVKRITEGKGVNVIYDGIGKSTFSKGNQ